MSARTRAGGLAVAAVVALAAVAAVPGPGAAATATSVAVAPGETTVEADGATTVDVVVTDADDGVGAYNLTVDVEDGSVASITDVSVPGDPAVSETSATDDGGVRVRVVGLDTPDSGEVTVASVAVEAAGDGETDLRVSVAAVGDESGNAYDVTDTEDGRLIVGESTPATTEAPTDDEPDDGGSGSNGGGGGSANPPTSAPTPTATTEAVATATSDAPTTEPAVSTTDEEPATETVTSEPTTDADEKPPASTTRGRAQGGVPGFTSLTAVAALALAAVIAARRAN